MLTHGLVCLSKLEEREGSILSRRPRSYLIVAALSDSRKSCVRVPPQPPVKPPDNQKDSLFDMVVNEIDERSRHLADMAALGAGKGLEAKIKGEIGQRFRELEKIDKARARELQTALAQET
jgi:hypothetical protein